MNTGKVDRFQRDAEAHLTAIEKLLVDNAKLTLVVRIPGNTEADIVLTSEADLKKAIGVLNRRIAAELIR